MKGTNKDLSAEYVGIRHNKHRKLTLSGNILIFYPTLDRTFMAYGIQNQFQLMENLQ